MRQWRLIYDLPTAGRYNMAVDEAILDAVSAGQSPPTLRFYGWSPPCLSLGYAQKSSDVDFAQAAALGWEVVRRPTGGRAILHTDELTYSLSLPENDPAAAGSVVESCRRISAALLAGLQRLGVNPQANQQAERDNSPAGPVCFETPSHYELTTGGRKLIGSAQVRRRTGVLQHGSLPLYGDLGRICEALVYPDEAARAAAKIQVRARAATLAEALAAPAQGLPDFDALWRTTAEALAAGFTTVFQLQLVQDALTAAEQAAADRLADERYGAVQFTRRR